MLFTVMNVYCQNQETRLHNEGTEQNYEKCMLFYHDKK